VALDGPLRAILGIAYRAPSCNKSLEPTSTMKLRAQLDAAATLLDEGAANSAVRMLRSSWEPELPVEDLVPLYCMWIRALCDVADLEHALTLSERAADEFPREPDILIALGNVYDLVGELENARDAFQRAIDADGSGSLQHYNLGAVLERLGDEDGAEGCYREAMAAELEGPTLFEASAALGALLRRTGRLEEAASVYEQYLEEDPINVDILVEHGICLSDLDHFADAVERFELALSLDHDHAGAWYNLAITQFRMGRLDAAMASMSRAREVDPGSPLTLAVLGSWYLGATADDGEGDLDRALSLLYGAIDLLVDLDGDNLSPNYASLVCEEVFEALWQRGRASEAREIARMAGQRDWITAHMLNTLNEADHGRAPQVSAFTVTARAEAGESPDYWPADAQGYTTGLTVLAADEDEARKYSLEYLRSIEPYPQVHFHIETVRPGAPEELTVAEISLQPRARGVVGVSNARAYFRH
jgi:tetratricopeptide (TPR) repeat protein